MSRTTNIFSYFEAVTREELRTIERLVNEHIRLNSPITTEVMPIDDAREKGAMALFGEKYAETVRVLTMGEGFSVELCGGTHADRTGDIGLLRVTSEQGIASGVRRIEAVTGSKALARVESQEDTIDEAAELLRADRGAMLEKIRNLLEQNRKLEKDVSALNMKLASGAGADVADSAVDIDGVKLLVSQIEGASAKTLPDAMDRPKNKLGTAVIVLASVADDKIALVAGVTKDATDRVNAGELVNHVAGQVGGKGGGRPDMARAGGSDVSALPGAMDSVEAFVRDKLAG